MFFDRDSLLKEGQKGHRGRGDGEFLCIESNEKCNQEGKDDEENKRVWGKGDRESLLYSIHEKPYARIMKVR